VNFALMAAELRRDEGERLFVYDDATGHPLRAGMTLVGNPTIGAGRNLAGRGISRGELDAMLHRDIAEHWAEAVRAFPWIARHDEVRQRAMCNLVFNLGPERLKEFAQTLALWERGDYKAAAKELLDSRYATQVGPRAKRVAHMLAHGVVPA
jgi:lysozyme